jgi:hypothetical protein
MFHQRLKEINEGNIIVVKPGESISLRVDCFCLSPHSVYTVLVPLQRCEMESAAIAVSGCELEWKAESE